jgi:hypothetical protein
MNKIFGELNHKVRKFLFVTLFQQIKGYVQMKNSFVEILILLPVIYFYTHNTIKM